jgi:phage terminase large subunit-like protein
MLQLGLRCGAQPRALVTTTPRGGCEALKRILAAEGTMLTGGTSRDNPHLPAAFLAAVEAAYGGTRMGREELDGEMLDDVHGSLWPAALLERSRGTAPGTLVRVIVGVDPPASAGGTCGIVACGLDADGVGWVLADHSAGGLSPEGWARKVAAACEVHGADRLVVETNQGGEMVEAVLRAAGIVLPVTAATASQGKAARAEPVAGCSRAARRASPGGFRSSRTELGGLVPEGLRRRAGPASRPTAPTRWSGRCGRCLLAPKAEPRVRVL